MENAKTKKTLYIILNVIIWLFVAFAVAVTTLVITAQWSSDGVPNIGGKYFINIVTDSMANTINEGDLIIGEGLTDTEKQSLVAKDDEKGVEGDIITFWADLLGDGQQRLNTHRIVRINYDAQGNVVSYVTKGDNTETNKVEDRNPVPWDKVICRYNGKKFSAVGGFLSFLQTSTGFLVVIVIPLILFFIYELIRFILTVKSVRGGNKKVISAEDEELIKKKAVEEYLRQQAEARAAEEAAKAEASNNAAEDPAKVEDVPAGDPPAEEAPTEEAPVEEAPAEDTPAEEGETLPAEDPEKADK